MNIWKSGKSYQNLWGGEVFDLFLQLSDPGCDVGHVTAAPLKHYITGPFDEDGKMDLL